jgi:hypothetical protein
MPDMKAPAGPVVDILLSDKPAAVVVGTRIFQVLDYCLFDSFYYSIVYLYMIL